MVQMALTENRWMRLIEGINWTELLHEFVALWLRVREVQLTPDVVDAVRWCWTAKSGYKATLFVGSFARHNFKAVWKADAENKVCFFWRLMFRFSLLTHP